MVGYKLFTILLFMLAHKSSCAPYDQVMYQKGPLKQFYMDSIDVNDLNQHQINEEIGFLTEYAMNLLTDEENGNSVAKTKAMIDLGLQLLEVQDLLYSKLFVSSAFKVYFIQ